MFAGCSSDSVDISPTYTIWTTGVILSDERFDMLDVYGFVDNAEMSRQIAEYLTETETTRGAHLSL